MTLGARLQAARKARNLTVTELSHWTGISSLHLYRLERDRVKRPGALVIKHLADALGVDMQALLVGPLPEDMPRKSRITYNDPRLPPGLFSKRLRQLRKARGLSLRELSSRCGIGVPHLSRLESRSNTRPSMDAVLKISAALDVSVDDLIRREES